MTADLQQPTECYGWSGKHSRMHYDYPDSLYGCCMNHVTFFHMSDHGECFKLFKTVGVLQGACRTLQDDAECLNRSCRLPQITTEIVPTFISADNRDHKSAQCDWGFSDFTVVIMFSYVCDVFQSSSRISLVLNNMFRQMFDIIM